MGRYPRIVAGRTLLEHVAMWMDMPPDARPPQSEVCRQLSITANHFRTLVSVVRRNGPPPITGPKEALEGHTPEPRRSSDNLSIDALLTRINEAPELDDGTRRKLLALVATTGTDAARVAAIKALDEKDRMMGGTLGAPPPTSDHEEIERLGRIVLNAKPELVPRALAWAEEHRDPAPTDSTP